MFSKSNFELGLKLAISAGIIIAISALVSLDFKKTEELNLNCSLEAKNNLFCNYTCSFRTPTNRTSKYDLVVNYVSWGAIEHISGNFSRVKTVNFSLPRREHSYLLLISFYNSKEKGVANSQIYC